MEKNKITIELHSLIKDIIRNSWIVLMSVLIGYMGIFIASHRIYTPEYTAKTTLVVNVKGANTGSSSSLTVTNEMANVFINIFTQPTMKQKAAAYLGLENFDGKIAASVMDQTNFIELSVTADQPQMAYELLKAVVAVHPEISQQIFANASIMVIRHPSIPTGPSNAISTSNKDLIISGCATISLAAIIMLSLMRDTVKNEEAFINKIDSRLIGSITHENKKMTLRDRRQKKKKSLLLHSNAFISLRFAEGFHKIAAKIEYLKHKNGGQVFAITSVAENEGKSTCAANIALSLADRGNRVVLIDLDGKKPAIYKIFGKEYKETSELANLFEHQIDQSKFRLKNYKSSSLFLALNTKAYPDYHKWIENGEVTSILKALKAKCDFIIIDTAPLSLDSAVTDVIKIVDKTLLVVRTDTVKTSAINEAIKTINTISHNLSGCILNDVYPQFLPFSFTASNQNAYSDSKRLGQKKHFYGAYYGKYVNYSNYGNYGGYGSYGAYGNYGLYGGYGDYDIFDNQEDKDLEIDINFDKPKLLEIMESGSDF